MKILDGNHRRFFDSDENLNAKAEAVMAALDGLSGAEQRRVIETITATLAFIAINDPSTRLHTDPFYVVDEMHRNIRRLLKK